MSKIEKRAIANDAVDGSKFRLLNSQKLRARNIANNADVELFELNNSDEWVFVTLPKYLGSSFATESFVTTTADNYILKTEIGALNGVTPLENGLVPSNFLPSYVDDVIEVNDETALGALATPETGKIYVTLDKSKTWRWTGSIFISTNGAVETVNNKTGVVVLNTDDVLEQTSMYYTQERFDLAFDEKTTDDLTEGANLYYTQARFDSALGLKTTDDVSEGLNLYYTQTRFNNEFFAKSTTDLTEGTNLYFTQTRLESVLADMTGNETDKAPTVSSVKEYVNSISASGGSTELFNHSVSLNGSATSLTGLNYFCAPSAGSISQVKLQIWTKNGVASGTLSIDLKKNTTPASVGMVSMFTTQPSINFATAVDYAQDTGVLATTTFNAGDFIRLDVTSIPVGFVGTITIVVKA